MVKKFQNLTRVKGLKEETALVNLQKSKEHLLKMTEACQESEALYKENKSQLKSREQALYEEILGKVVPLSEVDKLKDKLALLAEENLALLEAWQKAQQEQSHAEKLLDQSRNQYLQAQKNHNKFKDMEKRLRQEQQMKIAEKEELEIEDLFTKPQKLLI